MNAVIRKCSELLAGQGPLMKMLYEVNEPEDQVQWKFRPSVSVESLLHQLHEMKNDELALLRLFLDRIHVLAAIRHLPNIVSLLERLRQHYSYTLTRAAASKKTIRHVPTDLWAQGMVAPCIIVMTPLYVLKSLLS